MPPCCPLRAHLSIAAAALVFVLPVVAGVIIGGFAAGVASVLAGFLVYDFGFIPPYGRLGVAARENWVALAVYVVVMLAVARVVSNLDSARSEAERRTAEARRLFELSELLVEDRSVEELLKTIVRAVGTMFDVPGVALLVPDADRLEIAASSGEELSPEDLGQLDPRSGVPVSLGTAPGARDGMRTVALTASGRPVGILAMRGMPGLRGGAGTAPHLRQPRRPGPGAGPAAGAGPALGAAGGGRPVAARADGSGLPRPAHPAGHHEGGLVHAPALRRSRSRTPTCTSSTA